LAASDRENGSRVVAPAAIDEFFKNARRLIVFMIVPSA
jgi:hypothetical protein